MFEASVVPELTSVAGRDFRQPAASLNWVNNGRLLRGLAVPVSAQEGAAEPRVGAAGEPFARGEQEGTRGGLAPLRGVRPPRAFPG